MAGINSDLYHALFLSLTIERDWVGGVVGKIPWVGDLAGNEKLEQMSKRLYDVKRLNRSSEPTSPYYTGASLLPTKYKSSLFYDHPHGEKGETLSPEKGGTISPDTPISEVAKECERRRLEYLQELQSISSRINDIVYNSVGISEPTRDKIQQEIFLRTAEEPEDREVPDPASVSETPENTDELVKDLIHYFAMKAIRESEDGIIPLTSVNERQNMFDCIIEQFYNVYGDYAEDRLIEADSFLGVDAATEEAYPNIQSFVENDLFRYHIEALENTPLFWKISTKRLLSDAKGEGFACFIDYHHINTSIFDRLSNQYLEPRKAELRDRRSAANQCRNDESLSTSERADATEEFEFCSSAIEQITELEEVMQELGSTSERDFDDDDRERVSELAPKVATFREETAERIETLEQLREMNDEEWFQDTFSDGFWDKVDEWREEWLDALEELEHACEAYAKPSDEPVEAHLADLFDYFNWRLKGSDHYSSTGILFMTYYFEREGDDLIDENGTPFDNLSKDENLVASLATGIDDESIISEEYLKEIAESEDIDDIAELPPIAEFKALAEEIEDGCQTIDNQIPSDWSDRALSEITTAGYQPNRKHGVAINITPLAERNIVPEIVEDKVL